MVLGSPQMQQAHISPTVSRIPQAQANRHLNSIRCNHYCSWLAAWGAGVKTLWAKCEAIGWGCGVVMTRRLPIEMQHVHPTQHGITKQVLQLRPHSPARHWHAQSAAPRGLHTPSTPRTDCAGLGPQLGKMHKARHPSEPDPPRSFSVSSCA